MNALKDLRRALALTLTLTLATRASGASYADYSEVKMPDYGSALDYDGPHDSLPAHAPDADDYHQHHKDPPAPLEYKYEEDRGKADKRMREVGESDEWQNSVQKHIKEMDSRNHKSFDTYSSDDLEHVKENFRGKHGPRLKPQNPRNIEDEPALRNKHAIRYSWKRKDDERYIDSKENFDEAGEEFEDDKGIEFEDIQTNVRNNRHHRDPPVRPARRKPRDRSLRPEANAYVGDPVHSLRRRPSKEVFRSEKDMQLIRRPQKRRQSDEIKTKGGIPEKNHDEYSEYYDMKRVQNMKDKLFKDEKPDIYEITTMRSLRMRTWSMATSHISWRRDDDTDGVEELRRLMDPVGRLSPTARLSPDDYSGDMPETSIFPHRNRITLDDYDENISTDGLPERRAMIPEISMPISVTSTITRTTAMATTTAATITTEKITSTPPIYNETDTEATVSTENEEDSVEEVPSSTSTEMSLAEKSRLSILKKAQRKEMLKGEVTKKPPVLLQVTNALHTLVMVEPPTEMQPWQKVSRVHEDTSDNIVKVKRLMRKKLLSNAKDIHDLSENWDDMICDYIDMSLLEQKATASNNNAYSCLMLFNYIVIVLL